jgi:glycosyltransferase involved in cell wall biosynthesis
MRIVYITNNSFLDHSYTIVKELKKKIDIKVFIHAKEQNEELQRWCADLDAVFVKRKRFRNLFSFFSELSFLLSIKKLNADRIWFNGMSFYQAIIARFLLKNFIVIIHDVRYHYGNRDYYSFTAPKLNILLFKKRICTTSHAQALLLKNIYGAIPKIFQLPIINYYSYIGNSAVPSASDSKKIRFFFFGSVYRYKGIETLIEAVEILKRKGLEFNLSIFGKFKYNEQLLRNRINKLEFVHLTDMYIDYKEVHRIFCQNDMLILPYRHVTQCGPLLIGYNELVPSVCSDLPGFREYVDDGKSGLLFSDGAIELADKMELVIKNPALIMEMKKYIKEEIFKKFSIENLYKDYIKNLQQL